MPFFSKHKTAVCLLAVLLLCVGGFCLSTPWTGGPSPFTGPLVEGAGVRTDRSRYSPTVREIPVTLYSDAAELHTGCHADLERERDGVWYTLKRSPFCRIGPPPAMEVVVMPGEERTFSVLSEEYGCRLRPGRYRAVFSDPFGREYVAAEFEIG